MTSNPNNQVNKLLDQLHRNRSLLSEGHLSAANFGDQRRCIWAQIRAIDYAPSVRSTPAPHHWCDEELDTFANAGISKLIPAFAI
ncbi:MAG: hypothetical protein ACJ8F7_14730 [Gemmataceae bacterium]